MKIGVPEMLRKILKSKPKPDAYEPTSLPGLLRKIRADGDRDARRWAREMSLRTSSLSPKRQAHRRKRNKTARDSRRRKRS